MAFSERLALIVDARTDGASRNLRKLSGDTAASGKQADATERKFRGLSTGLKVGIAVAAGIAGRKLLQFSGDAIRAASDLAETQNKVNVIFGKSADVINRMGETSAESLGLSENAAEAAAAQFGNMFKTSGLAEGAAADMSVKMVQLAADMASFNNEDPSAMLDRLRSGLSGEAEPLRRFGVLLSEAAVKSKAMELGLGGANGKLTEAQKVQARYALILEQTTSAQGDFALTSDGLANKQRIQNALWENAKAEIGQGLLPAQLKLTDAMIDLIPAITKVGKGLAFIASNDFTRTIALDLAAVVIAGKGLDELQSTMVSYGVATARAARITGVLGKTLGGLALVGLVLQFKDLSSNTEAANKALDEWVELIVAAGGTDVEKQVDVVSQAIKDQEAAVQSALEQHGVYSLQLQNEQDRLALLRERLADLTHQRDVDKKATEADAEAQEGAAGSTNKLGEETLTLNDALDKVNKALDEQWDNLRRLNGELIDSVEAEIDFRRGLADGIEKIKEATKEEGKRAKSLDITNKFGQDNVDWLIEMIKKANEHAESRLHETKSIDKANEALTSDIDLLKKASKQAGLNEDQVEELIKDYVNVPGKVDTKITQPGMSRSQKDSDRLRLKLLRMERTYKASIKTSGMSAALSNAQALINKLNRIDGRHVSFTVQGVQVGSGITAAEGGLVQKFPHGGPVFGPGGPTDDRVKALLSNGEFVVNAAATRRNLGLLQAINSGQSGGAGGAAFVFNFPHYVGSRQELIDAIRQQVDARGGNVQVVLGR